MQIDVNWSRVGLGGVIAFLLTWLLFNLFVAVVLAIIVMLLLGIIKVK